jgi:hypothetical protein
VGHGGAAPRPRRPQVIPGSPPVRPLRSRLPGRRGPNADRQHRGEPGGRCAGGCLGRDSRNELSWASETTA